MTKCSPIVLVLALSLLVLPAAGYADDRDGRGGDDRDRGERSDARGSRGGALDGAHGVLRFADAALYELSENACLLDKNGQCTLDPSQAVARKATSPLQGIAKLGTVLCPSAVRDTNPGTDSCTVTVSGSDNVSLVDGQGTVSGTFAVVIQLDNPVDSPELPVMSGSFAGTIDFSPIFSGTPLGFATGTLTVKSSPLALELADTTVSFSGVFRNPFAISVQGRPRRGEDAFYLVDGEPVPVKQDERAAGWPTVRFEITFK